MIIDAGCGGGVKPHHTVGYLHGRVGGYQQMADSSDIQIDEINRFFRLNRCILYCPVAGDSYQ